MFKNQVAININLTKKSSPGWMGEWIDGWMGVKAGLRIAYCNQKTRSKFFFMLASLWDAS